MTYKYKYYLLLFGIPVLILLCWKLSVSRTFSAQKEFRQLKKSQLLYADPAQVLQSLNQELAVIRESDAADPELLDQQLLEEVSKKAGPYQIRFESFPETHSYKSNNYQVQTFHLRFSGRFSNLMKFIHYSEQEIRTCRLISVGFERKTSRNTGERLYADLYFQLVYKIN